MAARCWPFAAAITSGMTIGLFNRVRSQNGSTKFLGTEAMGWVARNNIWDTFVIRAVYPGRIAQRGRLASAYAVVR